MQLPDLDGNAAVESEQTISTEMIRDLCAYTLQQIQPRLNSFDDVVTATRKVLACAHSDMEDYNAAADALIAIDPGSQTKNLAVKEKIEIFLQISQFYLEDEESTKVGLKKKQDNGRSFPYFTPVHPRWALSGMHSVLRASCFVTACCALRTAGLVGFMLWCALDVDCARHTLSNRPTLTSSGRQC